MNDITGSSLGGIWNHATIIERSQFKATKCRYMEKGELKLLGCVPVYAQMLFMSSVFVEQLHSGFTFPKSNLNLIQRIPV